LTLRTTAEIKLDLNSIMKHTVSSAVTVSIFGYAVGFGRYFNKNCSSGSVSVFIVPGFNHVQSKH